MPVGLRELLSQLPDTVADYMEEIRLRAGRPLSAYTGLGEVFLGRRGVAGSVGEAYVVAPADIQSLLLLVTEYSLYAREDELKRGYLSLPGGHRAGFAGRTVLEGGEVKLLRDVSAVNIRIAREIKGSGLSLLPKLFCGRGKRVYHTLIVSAPQAGKTTLLRDLARLISDGDVQTGRPGLKVGIVDERSEIAGCYLGVPQLDVGMRSDVLDGCPKAEGVMMLIRSMSPQVVVTDELGRPEDAGAVTEVMNTGASVLASAHGDSVRELMRRPSLAHLLENGLFERIILLSRRKGPGTVEGVFTGEQVFQDRDRGGVYDVV